MKENVKLILTYKLKKKTKKKYIKLKPASTNTKRSSLKCGANFIYTVVAMPYGDLWHCGMISKA